MPLTHQYVTERFFSLVEFLPENKKEIIKEYWGGKAYLERLAFQAPRTALEKFSLRLSSLTNP